MSTLDRPSSDPVGSPAAELRIQRYSPDHLAPPVGAYSHLATVTGAARWVFISGQVGANPAGDVPADVAAQTRHTLRNIEALIAAAGGTPQSIVRLMTFLVGQENMAAYAEARNEILSEWFPAGDLPGHSLAIVSALAQPQLLVEIEGWIALPHPA
ncbi:enamine deaminase RidA (YjgF/YER057c/UK114 family) [Leucobacter luti]|uniref:Enamine deaminase RidA (YjgF/YER057c/UK114 family) n=1 Tax=Leucobacter luti TaxID=340320 RepID=A0A4R6S282_9MICO|nr:RidA family protein [Leucobacter luti]TDP93344.1 enamine deaminase RidA (YjgF/YER057c/UK114 family) [Leucobacter luti]